MPPTMTDEIGQVLSHAKTIAVVGLSDNPFRPSYGVSEYMQQHGYRIIPVKPTSSAVLGEKPYPTLSAIPEKIDIVNVFRNPIYVPDIVDEVIALKLPVLWLQQGVIHEVAAQRARQAGVLVFMDLCILTEHRKRFR